MKYKLADKLQNILVCPYCTNYLNFTATNIECSDCHEEFNISDFGQPDFRLRDKKTIILEIDLGNNILPDEDFNFTLLKKNLTPEVDFSETQMPWHVSKEQLSFFPKAKNDNSYMLDLGCGRAIHKGVCEHAGFHYVGIDFEGHDATILADAQALPFKDNSFEFILSIAVLEHIQYPLAMMKEIHRVLKPNGLIIGTVAFTEPFHSNSFYHHTHLGIYNSLKYVNLDIKLVSPSQEWTVLEAMAYMKFFPKLKKSISQKLVRPLLKLHKLWWKYKKLNEFERVLHTTGAFTFIANKKVES